MNPKRAPGNLTPSQELRQLVKARCFPQAEVRGSFVT